MDYKEKYHFSSDISTTFKNEILTLVQDKKVLDLACGDGSYLQYFGKQSLGLDLSEANLIRAKEKGLRVKQADLNNPPELNEKFEIVFMSHILEHVENPLKLLKYAHSNLESGGICVVSVPNEASLIHLVYPYFTNDGNHLYAFSIPNMKELFLTAQLKMMTIFYDYDNAFTRRVRISRWLDSLNYFPKIFKNKVAWAYWLVGKKKPGIKERHSQI